MEEKFNIRGYEIKNGYISVESFLTHLTWRLARLEEMVKEIDPENKIGIDDWVDDIFYVLEGINVYEGVVPTEFLKKNLKEEYYNELVNYPPLRI